MSNSVPRIEVSFHEDLESKRLFSNKVIYLEEFLSLVGQIKVEFDTSKEKILVRDKALDRLFVILGTLSKYIDELRG